MKSVEPAQAIIPFVGRDGRLTQHGIIVLQKMAEALIEAQTLIAAQAVMIADHEAFIAAQAVTIADHEARIVALEP